MNESVFVVVVESFDGDRYVSGVRVFQGEAARDNAYTAAYNKMTEYLDMEEGSEDRKDLEDHAFSGNLDDIWFDVDVALPATVRDLNDDKNHFLPVAYVFETPLEG